MRAESEESYALTTKGALKISSFNRGPEEERLNQEELRGATSTACDSILGPGDLDVHASRLEERRTHPLPSPALAMQCRRYIRREDVADSKYGLAPGCKGYEAANRGITGIHSEACRKREEAEISNKDSARYKTGLEMMGSTIEGDLQDQGRQTKDSEVTKVGPERSQESQKLKREKVMKKLSR